MSVCLIVGRMLCQSLLRCLDVQAEISIFRGTMTIALQGELYGPLHGALYGAQKINTLNIL